MIKSPTPEEILDYINNSETKKEQLYRMLRRYDYQWNGESWGYQELLFLRGIRRYEIQITFLYGKLDTEYATCLEEAQRIIRQREIEPGIDTINVYDRRHERYCDPNFGGKIEKK